MRLRHVGCDGVGGPAGKRAGLEPSVKRAL